MSGGLTDLDRQILDFEGQWFKYQGAKEQAIRDLFDLTATRYYQRVAALLDHPEALAYAPQTVNRLRRVRDRRQQARAKRSA